MLKKGNGSLPIIIDAKDILKDPERILKELCNKLNIPFYKEMLTWPTGHRESDGIWGKHWYGSVVKSTSFKKYVENNEILPLEFEEIYENCMEYYQQLYQHRMRL